MALSQANAISPVTFVIVVWKAWIWKIGAFAGWEAFRNGAKAFFFVIHYGSGGIFWGNFTTTPHLSQEP